MDDKQLTETHKKRIKKYFDYIVENLDDVVSVINYLKSNQCIHEEDALKIMGEETIFNQRRALLRHVIKYGSEYTYYCLLSALKSTQINLDLYNKLKDDDMTYGERHEIFWSPATKDFYERLKDHHKMTLKNCVLHHDQNTYVKLTLYPKTLEITDLRLGFRESSLVSTKPLGKPINEQRLFYDKENSRCNPTLESETSPRTVLLLGAPGVGKTATMYHFLSEHSKGNLWKNDFDLIIFILFKEITTLNNTRESLENFLFSRFGPTGEPCQEVLRFIKGNQERLLFILDGYDECNCWPLENCTDVNFKIPAKDVLGNLIDGRILPKSRILLTSRPHCAHELQSKVDRIVELEGLDLEGFKELAGKKLGEELAYQVLQHLQHNAMVLSLCSIPVNAHAFLNFVKRGTSGKMSADFNNDVFPRNSAAFLMCLIDNLLRLHDKTQSKPEEKLLSEILVEKRETIASLAELAYNGIKNNQQLFSDQNLKDADLKPDEVLKVGLLTGHPTLIPDAYTVVKKNMYSFPHLTCQEDFATFHCIKRGKEELLKIIGQNQGNHDMLIQLILGNTGDSTCQSLLKVIFPECKHKLNPEQCTVMTKELLQSVPMSQRRFHTDGEMFTIFAWAESQQMEMALPLAKQLVTPFKTLYLYDRTSTQANCNTLVQFFNSLDVSTSDENEVGEVLVKTTANSSGISSLLQVGGIDGLTLVANYNDSVLGAVGSVIDKSKLKCLRLIGDLDTPLSCEAWDTFSTSGNDTLLCLGLWHQLLTKTSLGTVCKILCKFSKLESLNLSHNNLSQTADMSESPLAPIKTLSTLKTLALRCCGLGPKDMHAIVTITNSLKLMWINIYQNPIGDEGAQILARGIKDDHNCLEGLSVYTSGFSPEGLKVLCHSVNTSQKIKLLDVSGNNVSLCPDMSMFSRNHLEEIHLESCNMGPKGFQELLKPLYLQESNIRWLEVSNSYINSPDVTRDMCHVFESNVYLQALCLRVTGLTDETVDALATSLQQNQTLKLLDIGWNTLSEKPIIRLLEESNLEHLNVAGCILGGREGMSCIAKTLMNNTHIQSFVIGSKGQEPELKHFVNILNDYVLSGSLRNILLFGDSTLLAQSVSVLKQKFKGSSISINFITHIRPFWVLSNMWYRFLPQELRPWLTGSAFFIK